MAEDGGDGDSFETHTSSIEMLEISGVKEAKFGNLPGGQEAKIFTLENKHGLKARVTDFGAILVSMEAPDRAGNMADLTHGYDTLEGWMGDGDYFGATVGRFGNRIAHGRFSLDGKDYTLVTNNEPGGIPCALHGGSVGFNKVLWDSKVLGGDAVEFSYVSKDGEEGFPGTLRVTVTYTLNDENELKWVARAMTDAPTVINMVHHSYWNLSGDPATETNDHLMQINADYFLATNAGLIPTGERVPVEGTPMDFRTATVIGERVEDDFEPLKFGGGYDHAWVVNGEGLRLAARAKDPKTGRVMEVSTNQPAVQFYGGNFIDGTVGKGGVKYGRRSAFCLETEGFPDAPNQPDFPTSVLRPGETYEHVMIHKFSAE